MRLALALAALAACTVERDVLVDPAGVVTSCDEAQTAAPGMPCAFDGTCDWTSPELPGCCTQYAYCTDDGLVADVFCDPSCACRDDAACAFGLEICDGQRCAPCPSTDVCPPCPDGWRRLLRNGCETCECAPAAECDAPGAPCASPEEICYAGATCAAGCTDPAQPGCCANACSAPGCEAPAPVGCLMACADPDGCMTCAADRCECVDGAWQCDAICVGDVAVSCFFP